MMACKSYLPRRKLPSDPGLKTGFTTTLTIQSRYRKDLKAIQKEMVKIINRKPVREEVSREERERRIKEINEPYKLEILKALRNRLLYTTWGGVVGFVCWTSSENTSELNPKALELKV